MITQQAPSIQYVVGYMPKDDEKDYFFNGDFTVSDKVFELLTIDEIVYIYDFILLMAEEHNGISYRHCFYSRRNDCALFICDQLSKKQIESGKYKPKDNFCVLMHLDDM